MWCRKWVEPQCQDVAACGLVVSVGGAVVGTALVVSVTVVIAISGSYINQGGYLWWLICK